MKKASVVVVMLLVGAGIAYASSIAVPWFIDDPTTVAPGYPPNTSVMTLIYLNNTTSDEITFEILYFNDAGVELGPYPPNNDFVIPPKASVGFRPCAIDPTPGTNGTYVDWNGVSIPFTGAVGGQESLTAAVIPNRPQGVSTDLSTWTGNGSCTISWQGLPSDVQGCVVSLGGGWAEGVCYAHLLGK
jgi:hypothetical protein